MKTIITILLVLFSTCAVNAQTNCTLDQLVGTKWKHVESTIHPYYYYVQINSFTEDSIKSEILKYSKNDNEVYKVTKFSKAYYLSDFFPKTFDNSKVGRAKKGLFLIVYNDKAKMMENYIIKSLTLTELELLHKAELKDEDFNDYSVRFQRVK